MNGLLFDDLYREPLASPAPPANRTEPVVVEPLYVEDVPTFHRAMSGERVANQREMILSLLRQGSVTNFELADICLRYSARIHELRKQGHNIETVMENKKSGLVVYRLKEGT